MTIPDISRRQFLEISAVTVGAAVVEENFGFLLPPGEAPSSAPEATTGSEVWVPTLCQMCGGQSAVMVKVVDGRVAKIEPNPDNPIGVSNISTDYWAHKREGAAMCPKGNAGVMSLYDPDRIQKPLKRTNPDKGKDADPRFVPISWEEAYSTVAAKLQSLRDAGEAHKLVWFTEDSSFTNLQSDFVDLYGTPNFHMHSNLCDVARKASFKLVLGDDRPLADFAQSRFVLLFGWNPTSATKWSHLPRVFTRAIENGARIVVVDPYLSQTAARAHQWVSIRPGTDGALALALAHQILRWNLHDQDFVQNWTVGFDKYADYLSGKVDGMEKSPEWAENITSVPAATIRKLAYDLGSTKPALVDVWSGPGQHSNAVQGGRAIAMLNALLGNIDKPGTMINPDRKGNARQAPKKPSLDSLKQPRLDERDTKYPFAHSSGVYTEVLEHLRKGDGAYQPKAGMVMMQNLVLSVPGTQNVIDALKKLEFLCVVDTHLSETALLADIVIPGTTYLERYELGTAWVTWTVVGLRQPVVKPIFGQPAEYEFFAELGRRLGLKDADGVEYFRMGKKTKAPVDDLTKWYEEYLSLELENGGPKITLDQLRALPGATWIDPKGTTYEKFKSEVKPPDGAQTRTDLAIIKSADGKTIVGYLDSTSSKGFKADATAFAGAASDALMVKDAKGKLIGYADATTKAAYDLAGKSLTVPSDAKLDDKATRVFLDANGALSLLDSTVLKVILEKDNKLWGYLDAKNILKDKTGAGLGFLRDGKYLKGWNTPSRLVEFFSDQAAAKKDANGKPVDGLPAYSARDWQPDPNFPFYLVNWKEASHTHSRTFNNPWLMGIQPSNPLAINNQTAALLGIHDGDEVWVESPYGKAKAVARLTEAMHPEVVGWQHGFGHWGFGQVARGQGTADGQFNLTKSDPISGMALHKEVCVKVYKA